VHPLEAVDWRLKRAHKHLTTLDRERKRFLARVDKKDPRFVGKFNSDTNEYVFRLNCKPPNPRLGLIVGEFAHNLRAALDNLVCNSCSSGVAAPLGIRNSPSTKAGSGMSRAAGCFAV
jgi:hypothetical protein